MKNKKTIFRSASNYLRFWKDRRLAKNSIRNFLRYATDVVKCENDFFLKIEAENETGKEVSYVFTERGFRIGKISKNGRISHNFVKFRGKKAMFFEGDLNRMHRFNLIMHNCEKAIQHQFKEAEKETKIEKGEKVKTFWSKGE